MIPFAKRMEYMAGSATVIKNLFKAMGDPETISFGGGAPARETLPAKQLAQICSELFSSEEYGARMLQYGHPEGEKELREVVSEYLLRPKGVKAEPDEIMIVNGGLETMNLMCQVFIDPGDVILVEEPTFVHCVEIFEMFEARCVAVHTDDDGIDPVDVEAKIKQYHPKFVYVIPTFQNPSGRTLSLERRKKLAELGTKYDVIILEDDPYRDIRFEGEEIPPIKSFDSSGNTVLANSFSKIFSAGARLGYVNAAPEILEKLYNAKTATNSQTNTTLQLICAEFFRRGLFEELLSKTRALYRQRRDVMLECIDRFFPEGTKRTTPQGGLFVWVELPEGYDTTELLKKAGEYKVAFIAGEAFFTDGGGKGKNCMRLSFGNVPPENIRIGMERLGKLLASEK
ncbi:MAG: PLP-dependent aminotransferase family protein [Oscillospiraceae bacterium]|nr:PLP-dependent aminotransferase family protein [Oscillospiraceae bacterium]